MCIRDSHNGRDALRARVPHHPRRPCLLYTSDAADDMQCVDLGGRRIIKKSTARAVREPRGLGWFFQAEDGIRDVERSRGLGDVYKRQVKKWWS